MSSLFSLKDLCELVAIAAVAELSRRLAKDLAGRRRALNHGDAFRLTRRVCAPNRPHTTADTKPEALFERRKVSDITWMKVLINI